MRNPTSGAARWRAARARDPVCLHALLVLLLPLLLTGCGGETASQHQPSETLEEARRDTALQHAVKHLDSKYICPMHPQIVRDEPGTCPICGMALVERRVEPAAGRSPEVMLTESTLRNMAVRLASAEHGTLWRYIRAVGRVEYDETRLAHVHPRAAGFIEGLDLRAEGEPVRRGQTLARLYAPDILAAQVDFLLALDPQPQGGTRVRADKARNLLRLLDVPEDSIRAIEKSREPQRTIPVLAPIDGVVTAMTARAGMYVSAADTLFSIADPSRVWVLADIFEHQIDWLRPGLSAEIRVPARPGRVWEGRVDYLYPALDPKARTLRVRLVFDNPDGALKPNMFANVVVFGGPKRDALSIPVEALIQTGTRTSVVKALGAGRFQPVDVVPGMRADGAVEILSGLDEGDQVVVSGQFLIDSESSLQASFGRLGSAPEASVGRGSEHANH